jgi:hypothetical protein
VCDHENLADEEAIDRAGLRSQRKLYGEVKKNKIICNVKQENGF